MLIENGANVNAVNKDNRTALMHAAFRGLERIVQTLIDKGAHVNALNEKKYTALFLAAFNGNLIQFTVFISETL